MFRKKMYQYRMRNTWFGIITTEIFFGIMLKPNKNEKFDMANKSNAI